MRYFSIIIALLWVNISAAQVNVSGVVTSAADGEPVIGATIIVKDDPAVGTATDFDGSFSLSVPSKETVLVFSYTGLENQEITVGDQTNLNVALAENASVLETVVVVGYGNQKRSNISGSVGVVTAEEILETPVLRVEQALQGRVAGVQVSQNSGSPGAGLTVRVRGIGSINNSDPLYIVDGLPVGGLDFLNPNDIESISVLKDAASTAIYGASGANGVVLITTKTGKQNQAGEISYDTYVGQQSAASKINLLNAREYAIIQNEAYIASGRVPLPEFANPDALGEGTDWQDELFGVAPQQSHQLTIRGGGAKSAYSLSGNLFEQQGIIGGEKAQFDRVTVRFNSQNQVNDWLSVGNNFTYINLSRDAIAENNQYNTPLVRALNIDPVTPVRKADGTYAYSRYTDTDIANPLNAIEQTYDNWTSNRMVGGAHAEIKILENLRFKTTYSADRTFATQDIFRPRFDLSNDTILADAPATERNLINSVSFGKHSWKNWQWENIVMFTPTFGANNFDIVVGTNALASRYDFAGGSNTNLPSNDPEDALLANTISPIAAQSATSNASENSKFSIFGRVNYDLDERYLFSASLRRDGSSRFGENNKYGIFPAASAGWVLSKEDFFNVDMINFMKLRASWGINGNDNIGDYGFVTVINSGQNYVFGPDEIITNGNTPIQAGNPDVRWEESEQTNFGLDVESWEGKLFYTMDYFIKDTRGMLYTAPIPFHVGAEAPIQNIASMRNTGMEIALNFKNRDKAFKYGFGGNISFYDNVVTNLGEGSDPIFTGYVQGATANAIITNTGLPVATFWGFETDGLFQNQAEVEAHAFQSEGTSPGDIRFVDQNDDGQINELDKTAIGQANPDFVYSLNADCEFKGFDLSVFLTGSEGNDIYNATTRYDFSYVNRPNTVLNRWTGEGTSNFEPRVNLNDPNQNARISDRFVEDGSYLKIKNVQLGYTLPTNVSDKLRLKKFRIYASAANLWTFTKYTGFDPEIGAFGGPLTAGIDWGFYPAARTYLLGLNATF